MKMISMVINSGCLSTVKTDTILVNGGHLEPEIFTRLET